MSRGRRRARGGGKGRYGGISSHLTPTTTTTTGTAKDATDCYAWRNAARDAGKDSLGMGWSAEAFEYDFCIIFLHFLQNMLGGGGDAASKSIFLISDAP